MFRKMKDVTPEQKPGPRNGTGVLDFYYMLTKEETEGRVEMFANIILHPGDSIGRHDHTENAEIYFILDGTLDVEDNGNWYKAVKGDVVYTANGDFHQVKNSGDKDASMLAIIIK